MKWFRLLAEKRLRAPLATTALCLVAYVGLALVPLPPRLDAPAGHAVEIALILAVVWSFTRAASVTRALLNDVYDTSGADNIRQRRVRTQIDFVYRLALLGIGTAGLAAVLLTFEGARRIGASLIASAGVASVVIGFAAQKSLANLIAGFQIAFTQPLRLDDVVIVEKEWGRVEEITLTYVVVKLWDLRRMVLPITYFVEKPFENWTRTSADLLGTVFLYVDYAIDVEATRRELRRIVGASALWDEKTCALQVTSFSERTVELRALVSARTASDAFDLRCLVREKLLEFLWTKHPEALPRVRLASRSRGPVASDLHSASITTKE